MGLAAVFFAATVAASGPAAESVEGSRRAQVRCKPAPYYVAERSEPQRVRKTIQTGSRVPVAPSYDDRRARPCHLMFAPANPHGFGPIKVLE